jgi:hypothetical protein
MMKTSWGVVFRLIALVIVLSQQTIAQVTSSCPETVSSLRDVSVQLTLMNGQTVSRQGEVVELKVRYSSRSPGKYTLSINRIDRSGRIDRGGRRDGVDLLCLQPDMGPTLSTITSTLYLRGTCWPVRSPIGKLARDLSRPIWS